MIEKAALFVMTKKGLAVLEAVSDKFPKFIDVVVTARDPSLQDDYCDAITRHCVNRGIPVYDRNDGYEIKARYAIAASWRWMLHLPRTELIVFHDSLLPRYRGFNPLVSCLINGEQQVGVSALIASKEFDRGDIVAQATIELSYPVKICEVIDKVSLQYGVLAQRMLTDMSQGKSILGTEQDERQASYSVWRDDQDYRIPWGQSASYIKRFVDAVGWPYKGASTLVNDRLARVTDVDVLDDMFIENRGAGKVLFLREGRPVVICGEGMLMVNDLVDAHSGKSLIPLGRLRTRFY